MLKRRGATGVIDAPPDPKTLAREQAAAKERQKDRLSGPDKETLIGLYRQMLLIRRFEEKAAEAYSTGKIGGFCHLYIGQEAVAVGHLSDSSSDYVLTSYREHGTGDRKGMHM